MSHTLLTVSTVIDPKLESQIAERLRPRVDYLEMARAFNADLIDYAKARVIAGWFGRILEAIGGPNLTLAWASYLQRNRYKVIFTDGEHVGIPLAWFCKLGRSQHVRHLMITHILSVYKKMFFFDFFRIQSHVDIFLVYSTWQKRFIEQRWCVQPERVAFTPFMVDTNFFAPEQVTAQPKPMISSAGLEFRDYPTLIRVAKELAIDVVIAAGSPFSKRANTAEQMALPANVTVSRFTQFELRQLYADSLFVVVPLYNVDFQAGVTVILEAMAMGKAVICSGTPGQTDVVIEAETGLYVPPEDPEALRRAIEYLLAHPEEAIRMGQAGRRASSKK
ncbi:MAG: glycosyltransferase family 4 protein [Caldilineaceae bacterium]